MLRITIESTDRITDLGGVEVRVWDGVTDGGVACKVFVRLIAVALDEDQARFKAELQEHLQPGRHFPISRIL